MAPMKAAFEDRTIAIPADADYVDDLRQIKLIRGIPMVPPDARAKGADGLWRHGDFGVATCLAYAASKTPPSEVTYLAVAKPRPFDQVGDPNDIGKGDLERMRREGGDTMRKAYAGARGSW
jgi:phage FluMu gp28-like protein